MTTRRTIAAAVLIGGLLVAGYSARGDRQTDRARNVYYVYTAALDVNEAGAAEVPARFQWSVETSWSGIDVQGRDIPDSRLMLRLYDPSRNFTALTAQMDLATAAKLHHDLGEILVKKLQNPSFQHRPQLYSPDQIPTARILGVDENGVAEIELEPEPNP